MKRKITSIVLAAALVLMLGCGSAFAAIPEASYDFYVADYAKVIDKSTENYIIEQNVSLENLCGGQIVVAAVDFLDGMDIEDYAYKMFNDWEIGDADEDNGVLLLLVIGEENYWCMQGKGLEKVLTSGEIDDILWDYLEDDFAAENYSDGVRKTFDALYDVVYDYYENAGYTGSGTPVGSGSYNDYYYEDDDSDFMTLVIGVIFLIIIIAVVAAIVGDTKRRRRRYYDGGTVYVPVGRPRRRRRTPPPPSMPPQPPMGQPPHGHNGGMPPRPLGSGRPAKPPRTAGGSFGKPSGGLFGGSSGGSRPSRPSGSSGAGRRSSGGSFGGGSSRGGGMSRSGGGASRGGGAGRRGR